MIFLTLVKGAKISYNLTMDINLLLLDLDDTLLNSKGKLSKRTQNAVKRAVEKGATVAIASGRMHTSLLPYVTRLNTHGPVVSYNGALIKDSVNNETIYKSPVPMELAKEIINFADKHNIHCQFYDEYNYFFKQHNNLTDKYYKSTDIKGIALGEDLLSKIKEEPPKLLMIENDTEKMLKAFELLKDKYGDKLHITRSKGHYIEIMGKGVNKGGALLKMCEIYNTSPEHCMAIGDGLNDIEMIKNAGAGVAVGTALNEVKNAADIVCASSDEEGPASVIEEYILS